MWKNFVKLLIAFVFSISATSLLAEDFRTGNIIVSDPWMRATAKANFAAKVFFDLELVGENEDILLGASSPIAGEVEITEPVIIDGIFRTLRHEQVSIIPGSYRLHPKTIHLVLIRAPLIPEGDSVKVILNFQEAGNLEIQVPVIGLRAPNLTEIDDDNAMCRDQFRRRQKC